MSIEYSLARTLINLILFLEFSSESVLDPDTGMEQLESVARTLGDMDKTSQDAFGALCLKISCEFTDHPKMADYVRSIPNNFGLSN